MTISIWKKLNFYIAIRAVHPHSTHRKHLKLESYWAKISYFFKLSSDFGSVEIFPILDLRMSSLNGWTNWLCCRMTTPPDLSWCDVGGGGYIGVKLIDDDDKWWSMNGLCRKINKTNRDRYWFLVVVRYGIDSW